MVALVIILTHNTIHTVNGQPTVQGFENEDSSIGIVAEIQQLSEANYQRQNEQVQYIHEFHNASFQEMRRQQDAIMTSLQAVDRLSQEQMRDMQYLNVSFQQMKIQLDSVATSLKEGDRRTHNLNVSFQQMKNQLDIVVTSLQEGDRRTQNLNVSFQQMKNQQDSVVTSLQGNNRCLLSTNTSNNN